MATISATLKMFDAMTRPLQNITQSMNLLLSTMQQMQSAVEKKVNIAKTFETAKLKIAEAEAEIKNIVEQNIAAQERLRQEAERTINTWASVRPMTIFQTSGIERLRQEISSAKKMLQDLQLTQQQMAGVDMSFLPTEANAEIAALNERIIRLGEAFERAVVNKEKLAKNLNPSSLANFNSTIEDIRRKLHLALQEQEKMNIAMRNADISKANASYQRLIRQIEEVEIGIRDNIMGQSRFNRTIQESQNEANRLVRSIRNLAAIYLSAQTIKQTVQGAVQGSDAFVTTRARLNLIVDEGQSVEQLQDMIYAASQRVRGDYVAMANTVSRLGLLAGNAFANTGEIVAFAETMQKAFKISGASIEEQTSAMYQLTQAMAAGRLQGDEFRSIMENAPMLADAIAKFTGKSKGELKEMAAEGLITADVIKGALFSAADDINEKFASMPKTFGEAWLQIKNTAWRAFQPVFEELNRWLNSEQGIAVIQGITNAIQFAAQAANTLLNILNILIWIGDVIYNNWGIIEPILITISSVLLTLLIQKIWNMVTALWAAVPPLLAQAAAWLAANWPILLIGAAIGFVIYALYRWGDVVAEVIGFVGGIFGALFGHLYNNFAYFANVVLSVAEFFINVWRDPVYAVKKLFYDLVINALQWLTNLARGIENIINAIPGLEVNITSGLSNLLNRLEMARANLKTEADVVQLMRFQQMDYREAFSIGQRMGRSFGQFAANGIQNVVKKVGGLFNMQNINKLADSMSFPLDLDSVGKIGKVGEVGRINDTVDISNEDLKIMRELAEMKSIQNFVTLTPTVNVTTGDIRSEADIDTIVRRIEDMLERDIASSAQGVFA